MAWLGMAPASAQVLPLEQKNTLTADWVVQAERGAQLVPYVAEKHTNVHALHQWVSVAEGRQFQIGFAAPRDLCVFLNNQLIFKANFAATYTLDLNTYSKRIPPVDGKYLLTVWHPEQQPNINSFRNQLQGTGNARQKNQRPLSLRVREYTNQSAFILFLLVVGLLYGILRTNFPNDFRNLYSLKALLPANALEEESGIKSVGSVSSLLFVLAFSLTLALPIAAIHTNVQQIQLFNQLFPVSEASIITKILFYTLLILAVILLKYLFLKIMGFIFGLEQMVQLQYRTFLRSMLFLGIFLPLVMLLYLVLNAVMPNTILLISNLAVSIVLTVTLMRVFVTVNKRASVLNLHLFSYLCATEVIPLAIMLKLIVFNF
ncbi:DUF4271 domain-containing protein [Pontibacter sp. CAU 1760]